MRVTFEIVIETDEAEPVDLAMAIKRAIEVLELPNGSSICPTRGSIIVKDVSE